LKRHGNVRAKDEIAPENVKDKCRKRDRGLDMGFIVLRVIFCAKWSTNVGHLKGVRHLIPIYPS